MFYDLAARRDVSVRAFPILKFVVFPQNTGADKVDSSVGKHSWPHCLQLIVIRHPNKIGAGFWRPLEDYGESQS